MDTMALLFVLVPLGAAVVIGLVVTALVLTFNSGSRSPLPSDPAQPVTLHARVSRPTSGLLVRGNFDSRLYGRLSVADGQLRWNPDQGESWAAPIGSITVLGTGSAWGLSQPHLDIDIAGSGPWRLVVSDRKLNRFLGNDAKKFREARRARELTDRLLRSGARAA
ncbi:hypothetical protein ACFQFC_18095 [Amorphoplanes digitatis]|uniref:Uncharacterized protein n=1 Tax=Actinoplanes digitatis TaxID=1868 RepID=A0A7W7I4H3_9ACTN|nr:hypothetical protein [Actinoplanes digitatis]MBB4766126.1 hypothetical protein [Actinoplanes digitatis]BFE76129.1 hypothetical protein GCM10020092_094300 [Actinoplanes digitatis]GID96551.1 hypothetical protein Adi01nite_59630 [Actinoplanes digitatis]